MSFQSYFIVRVTVSVEVMLSVCQFVMGVVDRFLKFFPEFGKGVMYIKFLSLGYFDEIWEYEKYTFNIKNTLWIVVFNWRLLISSVDDNEIEWVNWMLVFIDRTYNKIKLCVLQINPCFTCIPLSIVKLIDIIYWFICWFVEINASLIM